MVAAQAEGRVACGRERTRPRPRVLQDRARRAPRRGFARWSRRRDRTVQRRGGGRPRRHVSRTARSEGPQRVVTSPAHLVPIEPRKIELVRRMRLFHRRPRPRPPRRARRVGLDSHPRLRLPRAELLLVQVMPLVMLLDWSTLAEHAVMPQVVVARVLARLAVVVPRRRRGRRRLPVVPPPVRCRAVFFIVPSRHGDRIDADRTGGSSRLRRSSGRQRRTGAALAVPQALAPRAAQVPLDQSPRRRVHLPIVRPFEEGFEAAPELFALVRVLPQLSIVE